MNIFQVIAFVNFCANKEQSGNTLSPSEANLLIPTAQLDYITNSLGISPEKNDGRPILLIPNNLRIFKTSVTLTVTNGLATVPVDYMYTTALGLPATITDDCDNKKKVEFPVEVVDDDEWTFRSIAQIKKPTIEYPICKWHGTQIEFNPQGNYKLYYLRYPVTPVFAYTIVNGVPVYDSANSVQLELPDITHESVCDILLRKIGVNLSSEMLQNYAAQSKQVI